MKHRSLHTRDGLDLGFFGVMRESKRDFGKKNWKLQD
jgi:hypothetical protein